MTQQDLSALRIDRTGAGTGPRRRRRIAGPLLLLALCGAVAIGYWKFAANAGIAVEAAAVTTAFPSQAFTLLNATGYVVAQRKAAVSSKATGRLEWLGVAEGSRVKEGEIVARIENRDVAATVDQAAANVKLAEANLEQGAAELKDAEAAFGRSRELLDKGFVAPAAHDGVLARLGKARAAQSALRAAIGVAEASLRGARVAVDQTLIRAPFDGVVLTKAANVGDVVTPFSSALDAKGAVVTMADMRTLEVEADVSESNLARIAPGQPCEILLDAIPDTSFPGTVHRLVPTVDRAKATVMTKIRFADIDPRILPEMSAKVAFLSRPSQATERELRMVVVPSAVVTRAGRPVLFRITGDRVAEVAVETGERIGELLEIRSGVKAGDKVVARPPDKLVDGARVALPAK